MILNLLHHVRLSLILLVMGTAAMAQDGAQPREGGLTGTGIVGLLNNVGVVEVGGFSVELRADVLVSTPFGPVYIDTMRTGDMIVLRLGGELPNLTVVDARQVIQIIGPIAFLNNETLGVMGTTVFGTDTASEVRVGDWVAVNGYWREDGVVATRIAVVAPQDEVQIQGTYQPLSKDLGRVGKTLIKGQLPISVSYGEVVRVTGRLEGEAILMSTAELGNLTQGVQTLLTQGYQSRPDNSGFYTVLGTGISSVTQNPEMINWQELVTVCNVDGGIVTNPTVAPQTGAPWCE